MAQVNVTISGKLYRMACDDGQEEHLEHLAARLDQTIDQLRGTFGEIGDQRLTVMAAITMADRNLETEKRLEELESRIAALDAARAEAMERQRQGDAVAARAIDAVAERIERIATRLSDPRAAGEAG